MMVTDWVGYLRFRDAFAEVLDPRLYTIEWLDKQVLECKVTFWRTDKAAIIAELKIYPTGAADVHGLIAAGDMADIVETLIPAAEQWGRDLGCLGAIIESREGWKRTLKSSGYDVYQVALRKDL